MNNLTVFDKKRIRGLMNIAFAIALLVLSAEPTGNVHAAVTFTVDTTTDAHDDNTTDGVCHTFAGQCSLRAAVEQAFPVSTSSNPVTIEFSSGIANSTISPSLGTILWSASYVTLDGGSNNIKISGALLGAGSSVFRIQGDSNVVRYLTIRDSLGDGVQMGDFAGTGNGNSNNLNNVKIFNSMWSGVYIHGSTSGGDDNTVSVSLIGASSLSDTTCAIPNGNGYDGIYVDGDADGTLITSNRIVCNEHNGIFLDGSGSTISNTTIKSNYIGTFGSSAMSNLWDGIHDYAGSGTHIWGNIISGNSNYGVWLQGSSGVRFWNNTIGTDVNGSSALPNGYEGVAITDASSNISLGDPNNSVYRNVISGNSRSGIYISGGSYNTILEGNYIGLGADGTTVIPNDFAGVALDGAGSTTLSSNTATVEQFISGNTREGVYVKNTSVININKATFIGVAADKSTPKGNSREGILLDEGAAYATILSGVIANNGLAGIAVVGNTSVGNFIQPVVIHNNGGLAIDLGNDGHTTNGTQTPPGPNDWIEYPDLDIVYNEGIDGVTCPGCRVFFYQAIGDPAGNYGGGIYLDFVNANATSGVFGYDFPPMVATVTMIACDLSSNDCSEMSPGASRYVDHIIFLPVVCK